MVRYSRQQSWKSFLMVICVNKVRDLELTINACDPKVRLKGPLELDSVKVLETIQLSYLTPPSDLPLNLTHQNDFRYTQNQYEFGWEFIHFYNRQFFSEQHKPGFFIEAGALDGEFMSNTLWLELHLGWTGLLIEPDPVNFKYLVWKRRKAWLSNTCVSEKEYPKEAVFETLQQRSESYAVPWLYRANSRRTGTFLTSLEGDFSDFSAVAYSTVQCFPLASYLLALNVSSVDYLSLDVQGNEWDILKNIPWNRIAIRVLAVEHYHHDAKTIGERNQVDEDFVNYMENVNYLLIDNDDEANYIFVSKDDAIVKKNIIKYKDRYKNVQKSLLKDADISKNV
ncbi:uncharacterized protein LOC135216997 isoform X2 [Macrobrachium nipponense]|uniref:uncharacterized protein LOC135216997 isoform X2 n=1 Tax=Macrobrachium nipponense TaxID=159736 RepID=UPI0030C88E7A